MIDTIEDMYAGYDKEEEKRYEENRERFVLEQIELFHEEKSLLTRKF